MEAELTDALAEEDDDDIGFELDDVAEDAVGPLFRIVVVETVIPCEVVAVTVPLVAVAVACTVVG